MEPFACGFLLVVGWIFGVYVGTKSERNSWLVRAASNSWKMTTAKHCDGKFYYIIEERYFNNNYTTREKTLQEMKDEWCAEELKGWEDK